MWRFLLIASLLVASCGILIAAEDFDRIAPKAVPSQGPTEQSPVAEPVEALPGDPQQVLLANLKALVFLSTPDEVVPSGSDAEGVVLPASVPAPTDLTNLVQPRLGKPLTRSDLNALIKEIIIFYRVHNYPIVDVIVPEQDITSGVLQLVLLEGTVGEVTTTGNNWFSDREIRAGIRVRTGDEIRSDEVAKDLDWLNSNPFHTTDLVYQPGEKIGQTNLVSIYRSINTRIGYWVHALLLLSFHGIYGNALG